MDYEKKYKEALSKARDMLSYKEVRHEDVEYLFPELKENEDERLRKTTIAFLKEYADKGYENAVECIDWLERQGEQKPIKASYTTIAETGNGGVNAVVKRELSTDECYCEQKSTNSKEDDVRRMSTIQVLEYARSIPDYDQFGKDDIDKNIAWLKKQGQCEQKIAWNEDDEEKYSRLNSLIYSTSYCDSRKEFSDWLKFLKDRIQSKQGKLALEAINEKPINNANNVEPKFKVGDCIISHYNDIAFIESIDEKRYVLICLDGHHERFYIDYIDENWRLWTLHQDAQDGDVLVDENEPFIFKGLLDPGHPDSPVAYCGICENYFIVGSGAYGETNWWCSCENVQPATKKQCELLFTKMKEAGYEWDNDKKKLNQIKQCKH